MRLSDIKGEKTLDIMADILELADSLMEDEHAKSLMSEIKKAKGSEDASVKALSKHAPAILRNEKYRKPIVSILASIAGVSYEEYAENGNVLGDVIELLTQDDDLACFLAS